jgi:hypothetical protein
MQLRTKLAVLTMAGATAMLALASTPAMASQTVTETAYGVVHGAAAAANNPVIPVTWHGLVDAHGVFAPGGGTPKKGQLHTFVTSAGNLTALVTATPTPAQSSNLKACHFTFSITVPFAAVGGKSTGKFAGASGPGVVKVAGAGYGPRYTSGPHKGQCNTSNNAPELAAGAVESFQLTADLKL